MYVDHTVPDGKQRYNGNNISLKLGKDLFWDKNRNGSITHVFRNATISNQDLFFQVSTQRQVSGTVLIHIMKVMFHGVSPTEQTQVGF